MDGIRMTQRAPNLLCNMRGHWREQHNISFNGEASQLIGRQFLEIIELIHQRCQRCVETQSFDVAGDSPNGFVRALESSLGRTAFRTPGFDITPYKAPDAVEKASGPNHPFLVPIRRLFERAHEEFPQP